MSSFLCVDHEAMHNAIAKAVDALENEQIVSLAVADEAWTALMWYDNRIGPLPSCGRDAPQIARLQVELEAARNELDELQQSLSVLLGRLRDYEAKERMWKTYLAGKEG